MSSVAAEKMVNKMMQGSYVIGIPCEEKNIKCIPVKLLQIFFSPMTFAAVVNKDEISIQELKRVKEITFDGAMKCRILNVQEEMEQLVFLVEKVGEV